MDFKTRALCIGASDYGEGDKLLTLVSVESGKMTVRARSVKKPEAKLRMCAEVLCCGEYIINRSARGGYGMVIGCSIEDNFFDCWGDLGKYTAAQIVCETMDKVTMEGNECEQELSLALRALTTIAYGELSPYITAAWYLASLLRIMGVDASDNEMPEARKTFIAALAALEPLELDSIDISISDLRETLIYLNLIFRNALSCKINALSEALRNL